MNVWSTMVARLMMMVGRPMSVAGRLVSVAGRPNLGGEILCFWRETDNLGGQ